MNNKYVIAIEETLVQEFDISANNAEEAFRKAVEDIKIKRVNKKRYG